MQEVTVSCLKDENIKRFPTVLTHTLSPPPHSLIHSQKLSSLRSLTFSSFHTLSLSLSLRRSIPLPLSHSTSHSLRRLLSSHPFSYSHNHSLLQLSPFFPLWNLTPYQSHKHKNMWWAAYLF